ncbi:TetR/AcrR family transcriptional regulator [Acidobacteriota bacterium]
MKKKNLRTERKRQRTEENKFFILKAAEKVFAQKGYNLTTVDDIAEEAQFSKATLYRYFKSKRDIFFEVILTSFEEVRKNVSKIKVKKICVEEKLSELISCISSYYHKKKNIARIFYMEKHSIQKVLAVDQKEHHQNSSFHPPIPENFKAKVSEISKIICEIIKEGIESEEFRDMDVKDASFLFGAMLRGFHFRGPLNDKEYSVDESTALLHNFFLYGIKRNNKDEKGENR